ncbi:MAG TPA: ATP-binding protein [Gammaproteobacteria bacterium]|nr:ATP-binding protein [Gammaproteobacteria bacterium]
MNNTVSAAIASDVSESYAPVGNPTSSPANNDLRWRLLQLLNLFRISILGLLLVFYVSNQGPQVFGSHEPVLYLWTGVVYFALALLSVFTLAKRQPARALQTYTLLSADLVSITLIMHASGGLSTGLGSLLFVPVAASSFLLGQRMSLLFAALASLALLGEQVYGLLESMEPSYTHAGLLGVIFFATALIGRRLAARIQESEALAIRRGADLQNISQLNNYVIQHLATGVVVLDADGTLRQLNTAAERYLGLPARARGRHVNELSRWLLDVWHHWQQGDNTQPSSFPSAAGEDIILPRVANMGSSLRSGLLIFLEDANLAQERIQQSKLAALGRLTASIAHEVRNPLGAIMQANQLLGESNRLSNEDRRMSKIIDDQSTRVNEIIESVLQLSRREQRQAAPLDISRWLTDFAAEYCDTHKLPQSLFNVATPDGDVAMRVDPRHLQQIVTNLVDNAIRHGGANGSDNIITLRSGFDAHGGETWVEIEDGGPGVAADVAEHIFEPFYTRSIKGTGLGLFIARELCEINRARLRLVPRHAGPQNDTFQRTTGPHQPGACFRITFAAPEEWVT